MSKGKLQKFADVQKFPNVIQPAFAEVFNRDFVLKGKWNESIFRNDQPLILELGCGKGEYTIGLAKLYPEKNFLGIDIKGARIWKGAKTALESKIGNARFLRTRIDFITSCFLPGEVSELWITFPDPQPGKKNKRLTSARFLNRYRNILMNDGFVNLKTDSRELFEYTLHVANYNGLAIEIATSDLYSSGYRSEILSIRTFYESMWLAEGLKICFLRFKLQQHAEIHEPPGTE